MSSKSNGYLLMESRLGEDLDDFVRNARIGGASWRAIAVSLQGGTGVTVTPETIRSWFPQYQDALSILRSGVGA